MQCELKFFASWWSHHVTIKELGIVSVLTHTVKPRFALCKIWFTQFFIMFSLYPSCHYQITVCLAKIKVEHRLIDHYRILNYKKEVIMALLAIYDFYVIAINKNSIDDKESLKIIKKSYFFQNLSY